MERIEDRTDAEKPLIMWAYRSMTTSSQPQRRARPVVTPYSPPRSRRAVLRSYNRVTLQYRGHHPIPPPTLTQSRVEVLQQGDTTVQGSSPHTPPHAHAEPCWGPTTGWHYSTGVITPYHPPRSRRAVLRSYNRVTLQYRGRHPIIPPTLTQSRVEVLQQGDTTVQGSSPHTTPHAHAEPCWGPTTGWHYSTGVVTPYSPPRSRRAVLRSYNRVTLQYRGRHPILPPRSQRAVLRSYNRSQGRYSTSHTTVLSQG